MKKPTYNKTGTRQLVSSGWKEFDRQTNCITTGNVIANTQLSYFIRPWKERECNGRVNPEGHLMKFDLEPFRMYGIPQAIREITEDKERERSVILYMFFTRRDGLTVPFCWALTDYDHKLITYRVVVRYKEQVQKRRAAAKEAISYIAND